MLYSYNNRYPGPLPNRIRMPDGSTKTDISTFTEQDLLDAGYIAVNDPPVPEYPNILEWNGTAWVIRAPNEEETKARKENIKSECKRLLDDTDYKLIKSVELDTEMNDLWVEYRQKLRDIYNSVDTTEDVWGLDLPVKPE